MAATIGMTGIVFGCSEPLPLMGWPKGKIRLRLRNDDFAKAFVRTPDGIREFRVLERDGAWWPIYEQARNLRQDQ